MLNFPFVGHCVRTAPLQAHGSTLRTKLLLLFLWLLNIALCAPILVGVVSVAE